ncbi:MAG: zinc ABC transporter substrate-binding protein [Clostridia bacterium]|nr:zinc ABC transporter substrate-binding protein [Clostridia bacterium]
MKKKIISIVLSVCIIATAIAVFAACEKKDNSGKKSIVVSIFPEYDWVQNVLGDKKDDFNVTLLLNSGADLHNYQPSVKDFATISTCDMFVYVGGESDEWAEDAKKNIINKDMVILNLLDILGDNAKEEELIEGMQGEEEEEEGEEGEEEVEYDEHVWLSLKNAAVFVNKITEGIATIDAENADYYHANASSYIAKLNTLDQKYRQAVEAASKDTLLFGDRFPFRYLIDDYNLKYYAAFVGCSAETNASFETIMFLKNKVDTLNLKVILKLEGSDGKIANQIKEQSASKDQQILTLNSLQSLTLKEYESGKNYLSIMEDNLNVIKEALK